MNHPDGPPTRHLQPVDHYYDGPPDDAYETYTPTSSRVHNDPDAEQAVLAVLLQYPDLGDQLATQLDPTDFYRPAHETIWDTWHHLAQADGVPPDAIVLSNHLARTGANRDVLRLIPELALASVHPAQADAYARIIRSHARLRVVDQVATALTQISRTGNLDTLDTTMAEAVDRLDEAVMRFGATPTTSTTSYTDLDWVLTGTPPTVAPPAICERTDGTHLFYAGKVNGLFGDPESAKTWLGQIAGVEAMNQGGTFAMVDVDHNGPEHTVARLMRLKAQPAHLADPAKFRYYQPDEADELRAAIDDVTNWAPTVTLIDSLGEVFPMLGVSTNDGDELSTAMRLVCSRPAATGSCVITIDHLPKSTEARTNGYAIGSIAKKRMIRGSYIRCETRTQPAPGQIGRVTLRIEKDTAGELRRTSGGGYAGTFTLDSKTVPGETFWTIGREETPKNDDGTFRPTGLMEKISRHIEDNEHCSFRDIKDVVTGKDKWLRDAITVLVSEGFVARVDGIRGSKLHHSIAPYRQTEDDHAETNN